VEELGTFVPFSILPFATTFVGEQFWGRAARAFLTRKSRNARFIFEDFLICVSSVFGEWPLKHLASQAWEQEQEFSREGTNMERGVQIQELRRM
jgi:hypothetical protein